MVRQISGSLLLLALSLALALAAGGCVAVDGGAVEVGWDLRFADGRRTDDDGNNIDCNKVGFEAMTLALEPVAGDVDPCADGDPCRFSCSSQGVGTTDFVIPPQDYTMRLQVVDKDGNALGPQDGVVAPGPVVRRVNLGEITSLNVNLIIVDR